MSDHLPPLHLLGCCKEDRADKDRLPRQASERRRDPRLWQNRGGEAFRRGQGVSAALGRVNRENRTWGREGCFGRPRGHAGHLHTPQGP